MDEFVQRKYIYSVYGFCTPLVLGMTCAVPAAKMRCTKTFWTEKKEKKNVMLSLCRRYTTFSLFYRVVRSCRRRRFSLSFSPPKSLSISQDGINNNRKMLADDGAATMTSSIAIEFQMIGSSSIFPVGGNDATKDIERWLNLSKSQVCCRYASRIKNFFFLPYLMDHFRRIPFY